MFLGDDWRVRVSVAALATVLVGAVAASEADSEESQPPVIAFETPSGIHLIGTDGSGLSRLPGTRPVDQNPSWSPDGKRLVFWNGTRWHGRIYVAGANGSRRRLLTRGDRADARANSDQFPDWSPDGRLIAFESFRSGAWHIWVMRADGTHVRRLTPPNFGGYSPEWSPDGKRILYTTEWRQSSLATVDLGRHVKPVKTINAVDDWGGAWSPDGTRIVFSSTADHRNPELYVVSASGGTPRRLTTNTAADSDAAWSADGSEIIYTSGRAGLDEIYIMRADGTRQRRVTRIPAEYACCAAWKPNG